MAQQGLYGTYVVAGFQQMISEGMPMICVSMPFLD